MAAVAMAPAAQAMTTITSVNTASSADGSFTTTFNDAGEVAGPGGIFTETLDFSTTLAGLLGIRVFTSTNGAGDSNDTDLTRIFLTGTGISGQRDVLATAFSTDFDEAYRLDLNALPGNYTLTIQGTPALRNSGFSGQILFTANAASAVPEPSTWAMMLLGMGAVGYALRRSRGNAGERRLSLA